MFFGLIPQNNADGLSFRRCTLGFLELFDEADAPECVFVGAVLFEEFGGIQAFKGLMEFDGEVAVSGDKMQVEEERILSCYP